MTMNLFTQFAPPSLLGITMFAIIITLPWTTFLLPWPRWLPNRWSHLTSQFVKSFTKKTFTPITLLGHKWALIFTALMFFLLSHNILGLFPYTFTATTQLSMNLGLAVPFWLATILIGLRTHLKNFLAHLLPQGTPTPLIPFLIILEVISLFIRPVALGVRLTANLTAGHLLLQLISLATVNLLFTSISLSFLTFILLMLLTILEIAVAIIQAYVFVLLLSLYLQENIDFPPGL
uniref:ATP synthase subunit a n=1 Tax=Allobates aff. trilineatus 1 AR-2020 TaxID=2739732 RepID=A0A7M3USV3_9NEOB|nr:ATP synthase F0 subunit 6 [Allobates aff. trilineatus 1 AR-2020]